MSTPDITKAQLAAIVQAIIGVLLAFGVDLTEPQQAALLGLVAVLGAALVTADAIIRHGRSRSLAPGPAVIDLNPARKTAEPTAPTPAPLTPSAIASPPLPSAPAPPQQLHATAPSG